MKAIKKACILMIIGMLMTSSCSKNEDSPPVNPEDIIAAVEAVSDQYLQAWNDKDLNTLDQLTSNDGEFYGSDPTEIMDKPALLEMYSMFFEDTTSSYMYSVNMRKIRVSPDGNSAVIMERITFPEWSPKMPMCQTSHLINDGGVWSIDFICWGFIIKNDDVVKVNEVL